MKSAVSSLPFSGGGHAHRKEVGIARAAYNTTADVFAGGSTPTPYAYKFTITCRLVPHQHSLLWKPASLRAAAYITWNGSSLTPGSVTLGGAVMHWDWGKADIIECPPGSTNYYTVMDTDNIIPGLPTGIAYRRARLSNTVF